MDIPYGYDCYAFSENEIKKFESNIIKAISFGAVPYNNNLTTHKAHQNLNINPKSGIELPSYIRFTRKNEYYTNEQLRALTLAEKLNKTELNKQIFCGIKIQIGIGVVTNFLNKGMQYKRPNKGKSLLINGSWDGIVSGLTIDQNAANSYDMMFGNFLAYDEEFPYMKFGPFFALESKLVLLTGGSRSIETSSFGTNIQGKIWLTILSILLLLSLLASLHVQWQNKKRKIFEVTSQNILIEMEKTRRKKKNSIYDDAKLMVEIPDLISMIRNFFFIYFTMLLNKPSIEFDNLIWHKHNRKSHLHYKHDYDIYHPHHLPRRKSSVNRDKNKQDETINDRIGLKSSSSNSSESVKELRKRIKKKRRKLMRLPTSARVLSYLWSAVSLIMASIYSGELLAVILLRADQNIDTISQLINSKPSIEPVIRQDDFTYNLMLKSLDTNMLILHNMTKIIPRPEVYTKRFIERVSERKQALLGDDELIETIYEIYHKHFPLYRSKITYLQYPISIMYRKDLDATLERQLRRGMVQIFEMGLIQRWYQAQKETYIKFYDIYEKKNYDQESDNNAPKTPYSDKYKPLSMHHFESFFYYMMLCLLFAVSILILEIAHCYVTKSKVDTHC